MVKVIVMVVQKLAVMMVNDFKIIFPSICNEVIIYFGCNALLFYNIT